jgi:CRP/FNR family cyclic AMP-dependent transcriptional regulator
MRCRYICIQRTDPANPIGATDDAANLIGEPAVNQQKAMKSNMLDMFRHSQSSENFHPGDTVFMEGETGDTMYVVLEGHVEIRVGEKVLEIAGPGTVIGEMALINLSTRSATAIAQDDCKLVPVDEKQFLSLVLRRPRFALNVMEIMANRLRLMDKLVQFGNQSTHHVFEDPS